MTYVIILLMFIINENNAKLELLKNKISNNKSFAITGLTSFLRLFTVSKTASEKKNFIYNINRTICSKVSK